MVGMTASSLLGALLIATVGAVLLLVIAGALKRA
jgi:uncharacterized membrane protein YeaQ/YmgE (transglycosylase-associated protein family)